MPANASGRWSATRWNRPEVSQAWVTFEEPRNLARPSGVGSPGGYTTTVVPFTNGTNSSNVDASKASGDRRSIREPARSANSDPSSANRSTARCGTTTPLGTPVVPEVNEMYAAAAGSAAGRVGPVPGPAPSGPNPTSGHRGTSAK